MSPRTRTLVPFPLRFLAPVAAAAVIGAAALLPGVSASTADGPSEVEVSGSGHVCPSGEGLSVLAGQVTPGTDAEALTLPGLAPVDALSGADGWRSAPTSEEAVAITQAGPGSGPVAFVSGAAAGRGGGLVVAPCSARDDDGWFTGVGSVDGHDAELIVANPSREQAIVRVSAWGEVGEIAVAGDDTLTLEPGEVRRIAASDLAAGEQALSLRVERLRGVATAQVLENGDGAVTGTELMTAAAPPSRDLVLGVPDGEATRALLLTNPGTETARVEIAALGADNGTYVIGGLEDVAVEPGSVASVDLPVDGVPLRLRSDQPITATARAQAESDVALGTPLRPLGDHPGVVPVAGDTRLTVATTGEATTAEVEAFDAQMESLGVQELEVPEGGSAAIGAAEIADGASYLVVTSPGEDVYAQSRHAEGGGLALAPVVPAPTTALAPHVSWGGRWH